MAANTTPGSNVYTNNNIGPNKFAGPPNTGNRQALSHANAILTQDYTGRATGATNTAPNGNAVNDLPSPSAILTANALALVIPPNAVSMTMISTAAFNFGEVGPAGAPLSQSVAWPANVPVTVDVARQQTMYVTGTAALSFFFQTL